MNSVGLEVCIQEGRLYSVDLRNLLGKVPFPECLQISFRAGIESILRAAEVKPHFKRSTVLELRVIRSQGRQKGDKVCIPLVCYSVYMSQFVGHHKRKTEARNSRNQNRLVTDRIKDAV